MTLHMIKLLYCYAYIITVIHASNPCNIYLHNKIFQLWMLSYGGALFGNNLTRYTNKSCSLEEADDPAVSQPASNVVDLDGIKIRGGGSKCIWLSSTVDRCRHSNRDPGEEVSVHACEYVVRRACVDFVLRQSKTIETLNPTWRRTMES